MRLQPAQGRAQVGLGVQGLQPGGFGRIDQAQARAPALAPEHGPFRLTRLQALTDDLQRLAKKRVEQKMGFLTHLLVFVLVNSGLYLLNLLRGATDALGITDLRNRLGELQRDRDLGLAAGEPAWAAVKASEIDVSPA